MYQFNYQLSDSEYLEFNKYHLYNDPTNKKRAMRLRLVFPITFLLMLLVLLVNNEDSSIIVGSIVFFTVLSVGWGFLVKPYLFFVTKGYIKALKKTGKLPYAKDIQMQFEENDIYEKTDVAETKMNYSKIQKAVCGSNAIYIYINTLQAMIIPFSAFENENQRIDFLAFIDTKINSQLSGSSEHVGGYQNGNQP